MIAVIVVIMTQLESVITGEQLAIAVFAKGSLTGIVFMEAVLVNAVLTMILVLVADLVIVKEITPKLL